ncbi:hypothetical protein FRC12_022184 [Ceratobasidium sp. 428]|nr:hypothetical protein FRC12_022184 [Ceratobasidium sp. 428]
MATTSNATAANLSVAPSALEMERDVRRMQMSYPIFGKPKDSAQKAANFLLHCADVDLTLDRANQLPAPIAETIGTTLQIVNDVVSRATGAVIYSIAAWDDLESGDQVFESIPERLGEDLKGNKLVAEGFLYSIHKTLGPSFSRDFYTTYPAIYGLKTNDWRPRLPPEHPQFQQEVDWIDEYVQALALWQCVIGFSWESLAKDFDSRRHNHVLLLRLPTQLKQLTHPSTWSPDQVKLMADHIRLGQQVLDRGDVSQYHWIFQFREGADDLLRLTARPTTKLQYNYDSTMYYGAMLRFQYSDDAYNAHMARPPLIPSTLKSMFETHALAAAPELGQVWKAIEKYQQSNPPEQQPHDSDPELFKLFDFAKYGVEHFIKLPRLPDSYMRWLDPAFRDWHPSYFVFWVTQTKALYDFDTQVICGGYGGIIRVLFVILLMSKTRSWASAFVRSGKTVPNDLRSFGDDENEQIRVLIQLILTATSESTKKAPLPTRPILRPGTRRTWWPAEQINCSNNLGLKYTEPINRDVTIYHPPAASNPASLDDHNEADKEGVIEIHDSDDAAGSTEDARVQAPLTAEVRVQLSYTLDFIGSSDKQEITAALAADQAADTPEPTLRSGSTAKETEPRSQIVFPLSEVQAVSESRRRSSSEPPAQQSRRETPRKTAEMVRVDDQTDLFQDLQDTSTPWTRGRATEVKSRSDHREDAAIEDETRSSEVKPRMTAAELSAAFNPRSDSHSRTPTRGLQAADFGSSSLVPQRAVSTASRRPGTTPNYFAVAAQQTASSRSRDTSESHIFTLVMTELTRVKVLPWVQHQPSFRLARLELRDRWYNRPASRR